MQQPIKPIPPEKKTFQFPWWKRWWHWYRKTLWYLGLLVVTVMLLLLLPPVQTQLAHWANRGLSKNMDFDIQVRSVSIQWLDELKLMGLRVTDPEGEVMIEAEVLKANFSLLSLIRRGDLHIDQAVLADATVRLVQEKEGLNFSTFISQINELTASETPTDTLKEPMDVHIDNIILDNVRLVYEDPSSPRLPKGQFDYNHIDFREMYGVADDFLVARDTIALQLRSMRAQAADSSLNIRKFGTFFRYRHEAMEFYGLDAQINDTHLTDSLVMHFNGPEDLSNFTELVRLDVHLDSSVISTKDLALFAPSLSSMPDVYTISGRIKGTVANLLIKDLDASFGSRSRVRGQAAFLGLPDMANTLLDIRLDPSKIYAPDLAVYLPFSESDLLEKVGHSNIEGDFYGFLSDFQAEGKFDTELGYLETDLNLMVDKEQYKGFLKAKDLDLGALSGQEAYLQKINIEGEVSGRGFSLAKADLNIDAAIGQLGVMYYSYDSIYLDAHIRKNLFEGVVQVLDPNLKMKVDGSINFADSTFNFVSQLDTLNLKPTKLSEEEGSVSLAINANFSGLKPSEVLGDLDISGARVTYGINEFQLDSLAINAKIDPESNIRSLSVSSDIMDLEAKGDFNYEQLIVDAGRVWQEVNLYVLGNDSLKQGYFGSKTYAEAVGIPPYWVECKISLYEEVNAGLRLFDPYIFLEKETQVSFTASKNQNRDFLLEVESPSIIYKVNQLWENSLSLRLQQLDSSRQVQVSASATSARQEWGKLETDSLIVRVDSQEDSLLKVQQYIQHASSSDLVDLQVLLAFHQDSVVADLSDTHFSFLDKKWESQGECRINVLRDFSQIGFQQVNFTHEEQLISMDGLAGKDSLDRLSFSVSNLGLEVLTPYVGQDVAGSLRAEVTASQALSELHLDGKVNLFDLEVGGYPLGTLEALSQWNPAEERLSIDAFLEREGFRVFTVNGHYSPQEPNPRKRFDLNAVLDGLSLRVLEPFAQDLVSNLKGTAIGLLTIKGSPGNPLVRGDVLVHKGQFTLNYLNTTYSFSDQIKIREDFIGLEELKLYDSNRKQAILNGGVYHNNFSNFIIDLTGRMDKFIALNTKGIDNSPYYGTAIATGSLSIFGPPNDLDMRVNAKTEKGTKLYIPLDGYSSISEADFITFVKEDTVASDSLAETMAIEEASRNTEVSGIKMDFNIEITPDAYCEIIFDEKAGDIIRGNAKGRVKMEIDLLGEFSMYGDVEVVQGSYNFTLMNVVNKQFGVQPNSFIRWTGDPYGAQLDITATYSQKSSLIPVFGNNVDSTFMSAPELRRAYPVEVLLHLNGELLSPDITFGLDIEDYPSIVLVDGQPISLESYVAGFEQRLQNDEQELNKQVFSLIVLKRLSLENAFQGISQSAGSSVSELFSNQFSYWISQVDENLEIDVDLNGLTPEALNSFQLNLSYTTMNGRLRISREGGFTNLQNEADLTSVIGDWTVEYLLSPDGKLRLKMYRRHNTNTLLGGTALEGSATNGVSILRSKTFDSFKELFGGEKKAPPKKPKKPANEASPANREEDEGK